MRPGARKLVLTTHVAASVGWLGAVVVFVGLAVIALVDQDVNTVRAVYLVMEPAAWYVLIPLAAASLLTGLLISLGTAWGLFRHYWVLFKLLINVGALVVLVMYTQTLAYFAGVAADPEGPSGVLKSPSVLIHAVLAAVMLLLATVLAVYKPRGRIQYGSRTRTSAAPPEAP